MDSGLPPLVWELRTLIKPLALCGKSDFFQKNLNMVFFMVLPISRKISHWILKIKMAYLQSSGSK